MVGISANKTTNVVTIETNGLTRSFGAVHAVAGLTMRVPAGRIYGLIGADGAGKTTTLRILCALMDPTSGQAWVAGHDVAEERASVARAVNGEKLLVAVSA